MTSEGIEGAIIGRALYDGAFTLAEAIVAIEARYDPYEWGPPRP
jgi:phosphoribosylformimino-5-aminoimidazole carboxamide ribonucleotide (ProFAR) isomerase